MRPRARTQWFRSGVRSAQRVARAVRRDERLKPVGVHPRVAEGDLELVAAGPDHPADPQVQLAAERAVPQLQPLGRGQWFAAVQTHRRAPQIEAGALQRGHVAMRGELQIRRQLLQQAGQCLARRVARGNQRRIAPQRRPVGAAIGVERRDDLLQAGRRPRQGKAQVAGQRRDDQRHLVKKMLASPPEGGDGPIREVSRGDGVTCVTADSATPALKGGLALVLGRSPAPAPHPVGRQRPGNSVCRSAPDRCGRCAPIRLVPGRSDIHLR